RVEKTLPRHKLWLAQTPQAFKTGLILKAYKNIKTSAVDDAALVEELGAPVKVVRGSYRNIKITTPDDLSLAEAMLKNK
ncbi:MAG: IspD/TarI family cytidylyltransferase, partial [Candidatus Omnitrophota bacterium]